MTGPRKIPGDLDDFLTGGGEMGARMRIHDWASTPFGSLDGWPQSLRSALSICLGSSFPIAIYWGAELALLYNDAWSQIPGQKHPWALGRPGREVWPEIWDTIGPMFERVLSDGEATRSHDQLLAMHRHGFTEECYFDYTFSPIRDEAGGVGGIFNIAVETTFRILGERRTRLLKDLGELTTSARTAEEACSVAATALATDAADLPFCLIYLLNGRSGQLTLAGCTGLQMDTSLAPTVIRISDSSPSWPAAEAVSGNYSVLVEDLGRRFRTSLPGGLWPEPCERALVVPLPKVGGSEAAGALIAGISPRLVLDNEYRSFLDRVANMMATAIANARAYEEERRRVEALAELDRAKTTFFSNISHEFRTPLTLMLGPIEDVLQTFESSSDHSEERELLGVVHRNGLRLQRLVNTLLDFSRIEAGRAQARYEPTDLAVFTAELAASFRSAMDRGGLEYTVDCKTLARPVYVDREMWEKIVLNLISNAFKYTLHGAVRVTLTDRNGAAAELAVADTGPGISPEHLPHLFERFHRVEGTPGRTHEGTGIGLALVQELVKLHGGTITVESTVGEGSTFTVSLPFGKDHLPPDRIGADENARPTALHADAYIEESLRWLPSSTANLPEPVAESGSSPIRSRVLLADDNADMREYVRRLLSSRYDVTAVQNGQEALGVAVASPPDLVLTDVMMPQLDGFGLLSALRQNARTQTIPVIMLSARAGEDLRVEGLTAGADDYLVKPFTARELLARVEAHLSLIRMRREAEKARQLSELRLGLALQATGLIAWQWDPVQDQVTVIGDTRRIFGAEIRSAEEAFRLIHPEDLDNHRSTVEKVAREGGVYRSELRIRQVVSGNTVWLADRGSGITDECGRVVLVVGVTADVTEQKAAEEAIAQQNEELLKANRELEEFAYVSSHDLQEPLRMVNAFTQLLVRRAYEQDGPAQEYAKFIEQGVLRMETLIRDLLSYSRTIHKEDHPVGTADLTTALGEAISVLGQQIAETDAVITADPLPVVRGDTQQMTNVFQNLLSNSLKYRKRDVHPEIRIKAEQADGRWTISLQDNGIGFDQKYAERIFGLFKRLHGREYPGTGLGLAICNRIIARYGGRIWAEGQPGVGATVYFTLCCPDSSAST